MIKAIPETLIESGREFIHRHRRDRSDVYIATEAYRDPATISVKVRFELVSVECNPDIDW